MIVIRILLYILAAISFWYGFMLYRVHSGSYFFLIWGCLGFLLIVLGLAIKTSFFQKLPAWLNIGLAALSLILILVIVFLLIRIVSYSESEPKKDLDYIIVLGAQVRADGPSRVLRYRLEAAEEYLKSNPHTMCIVSGGKGSNEHISEAEAMKKYLTESGIDPKRIIMEDKSTDTSENILFSKKLLPEGASIGIVTSNFHLCRSIYLCKKHGLENVFPVAARSEAFYAPNNYLREVFGYIKDLIF